MADKIKWACPKCGSTPDGHPKGSGEKCKDMMSRRGGGSCMGFICECEEDGTDPDHGETFAKPCQSAICHHCGWSGSFPKKPKGLLAWEKTALDAGWTMPEARKKELGI